MSDIEYKHKYLKYKNKYLDLKNKIEEQNGGFSIFNKPPKQPEDAKAKAKEGEVEVFPMDKFEKNKFYAFALYTREYNSPDYKIFKYFTTNPLQNAGYHVSSARWGHADSSGGYDTFKDLNGKETHIEGNASGSIITVTNSDGGKEIIKIDNNYNIGYVVVNI
jgi:hypothetical protein